MNEGFAFGAQFEGLPTSQPNTVGSFGEPGSLPPESNKVLSLGSLKESIKDSLPEFNRVQTITLKSGDTSFEVRNSDSMNIVANAAVSITTITNGYNGQLITLIFNDSNVTLVNDTSGARGTLNLGGFNYASADGTTLLLISDGTSWSLASGFTGTLRTVSAISDLQAAINIVANLGGGIVSLIPGTYNATSSFTVPSGVTLEGNGSTIDFGGGAYQILVQGSSAYNTGTLAVSYGSVNVVGTGTTWTAGMVGQSILIGDYWYTIATRTDNTHITLSASFIGTTVSGVSYVIATTVDGASINNITLMNASGTLLKFRYCNGFSMDGVTVSSGAQGIDGDDSANVNWLNSSVDSCTVGITYDNVPFCTFNNGIATNITGGTAIALTGVTNTAIGSISVQAVTGVGVKFTNCYNLGFINFAIIECSSHGIEFVSGNRDTDVIAGYIDTCGGDAIKLTATSDTITIVAMALLNNTGYGINIAASSCDNNVINSPVFTSNVAGTISDSGTNTTVLPLSDIQIFTANGTWTKPAGAKSVRVIAIGPGGAGAGGRSLSSNGMAGTGGGSGSIAFATFSGASLPSSVTVTVPAGGVSGAADTDGGDGSNTSFGTYLIAYGGRGGSKGSATAKTGGTGAGSAGVGAAISTTATLGGSPASTAGVAGISGQGAGCLAPATTPPAGLCAEYGGASAGQGSSNFSATSSAGGSSIYGPGAGGGGGSQDGAVVRTPGVGGTTSSYTPGGGGTAGTSGASPTPGGLGTSRSGIGCGDGGGGGGSTITGTTNAAAGGDGGAPGGGGGGGGSSKGGTAGAGGNGGRGELIVISS